MTPLHKLLSRVLICGFVCTLMIVTDAWCQVTPNEILNGDLRALEEAHFQQLMVLNQSVARMKFPFSFYLSRYVGLEPAQQVEADSRGLEFVRFQDRKILKVSGNYNAAYNTLKLTQNERATATFRTIVLPILNLATSFLPADVDCDGIGFEISHHTRTSDKRFEFEGKEILVVVLERDDAWAMSRVQTDPERQEILNRNKVFMSGSEFGLSLTEKDPLNVQALPRAIPAHLDATSTARSYVVASRSPFLRQAAQQLSSPSTSADLLAIDAGKSSAVASAGGVAADPPKAAMTQRDADRLEDEYKLQLEALAKEGARKFHFVSYAMPAFVVFHNQIALQLTMKDTLTFGAARGSIYRRAAQSFDLFLAPQLRDMSSLISPDVGFQLYDFSILNRLSPTAKETSEAIEYICPRAALKQFVDAEITNQQLLDQSVILVNGVRIALNLQLVE